MQQIRCRICGEIIGMYEPMTVVANGIVRLTSRAAEAVPADSLRNCFHAACFSGPMLVPLG